MNFEIITLFPKMFPPVLEESILGRALRGGVFNYATLDLREFGLGPRRQVDDTVYGGGAGMLLRPEPLAAAVDAAKQRHPGAKTILLSASGKKYTQKDAQRLAKEKSLILVCGRYEGVDERFVEKCVDEEFCLSDSVFTGGELPAMAMLDSIVRLLPGALGDEASATEESFSDGLVEYPQYTKPEDWQGLAVPDVLRSGHHAEIEAWRRKASEEKTRRNRPDLLK
jgi:tRNA (guanine37-N1)-methyltransferase